MASAYTRIKILPISDIPPDDSLVGAKIVTFYGFWQYQVAISSIRSKLFCRQPRNWPHWPRCWDAGAGHPKDAFHHAVSGERTIARNLTPHNAGRKFLNRMVTLALLRISTRRAGAGMPFRDGHAGIYCRAPHRSRWARFSDAIAAAPERPAQEQSRLVCKSLSFFAFCHFYYSD
jgi:hypothetical protein